MHIPKDIKLDPDRFAGKSVQFGNTRLTFGKGRNGLKQGDLLIEECSSTQSQQSQMLEMQFKKVLRGDVPDVCGQCGHCKSVEYGRGGGQAAVPTCTHPHAPDRDGQPLFVDPNLAPETNSRLCPLLHERSRKMQRFFDMKALPGREERKRGQRSYNPAKGK